MIKLLEVVYVSMTVQLTQSMLCPTTEKLSSFQSRTSLPSRSLSPLRTFLRQREMQVSQNLQFTVLLGALLLNHNHPWFARKN
jgi:hypothetical protein